MAKLDQQRTHWGSVLSESYARTPIPRTCTSRQLAKYSSRTAWRSVKSSRRRSLISIVNSTTKWRMSRSALKRAITQRWTSTSEKPRRRRSNYTWISQIWRLNTRAMSWCTHRRSLSSSTRRAMTRNMSRIWPRPCWRRRRGCKRRISEIRD